jgi:hypothetical protein
VVAQRGGVRSERWCLSVMVVARYAVKRKAKCILIM